MILLANGCSHTAGAELEESFQSKCYEKAWPAHLGKLLAADEVVNLSDSGASQKRIIRTTLEYIGTLIHNGEWLKVKNLFVVILWPGAYRDEMYHKDHDGYYNIVVGNDELYRKGLSKAQYEYYKAWVVNYEKEKADDDSYLNVILLQNYLSFYKIPFLFWNASNSALSTDRKRCFPYQAQINRKRFPYFHLYEYGYTYLAKTYGHQVSRYSVDSGFNSHYDEDTHKWWAKYLKNYIIENDILPPKTS